MSFFSLKLTKTILPKLVAYGLLLTDPLAAMCRKGGVQTLSLCALWVKGFNQRKMVNSC